MTFRPQEAGAPAALRPASAGQPGPLRWLAAAGQTARPRQWPKNLLVFAAPLAGASLGGTHGLGYSLAAAAVRRRLGRGVLRQRRDRRRPRPPAPGQEVPARGPGLTAALQPRPVLAALSAATGIAVGLLLGEPRLSAVIGLYLVLSMSYTLAGKHIPVLELCFVASGFVLRALGGATATHVPPSSWFLLVCSLGAVMVAIAKRYTELTALAGRAAAHRPVMRAYSRQTLRLGQRVVAGVMIAAYLLWARPRATLNARLAPGERRGADRGADPLRLAHRAGAGRPVEDLIAKDGLMLCCELLWLALFVVGMR